jgi:hypothetical protein
MRELVINKSKFSATVLYDVVHDIFCEADTAERAYNSNQLTLVGQSRKCGEDLGLNALDGGNDRSSSQDTLVSVLDKIIRPPITSLFFN